VLRQAVLLVRRTVTRAGRTEPGGLELLVTPSSVALVTSRPAEATLGNAASAPKTAATATIRATIAAPCAGSRWDRSRWRPHSR
jgi:hypothetical protein